LKIKKLIIICGPTGIGKTKLSIKLAKHLNCEIISADSRQFYKEMLIGTCPPNKNQLLEIKHHFIHNISVQNDYSAGLYQKDVLKIINKLFEKYNVIIAVGGSGMYIDAICNKLDDIPASCKKTRSKIISIFEKKGIEWLRNEIKKIDQSFYKKVDLNNHQRMIRALEVYEISGKPISSFHNEKNLNNDYQILKFGLRTDRDALYSQINKRVDLMIDQGLIEEAKKLYDYRNLNALDTVGYKELFNYIEGAISRKDAINLIKRNSRRYAKRQITWFKKFNDIHWIEKTDDAKMLEIILQSLQSL